MDAGGTSPEKQNAAPARTAKAAVWSLVLGIASLVLCLIGPAIAVPGIICGHKARKKIRRSNGAFRGNGMALAGLITSYAGVFLFIAVGLLIPRVGAAGESARRINCCANLKQIRLALEEYASDYQDAYPPDFATLAREKYLDAYKIYVCPSTTHAVATSVTDFAPTQYQSYAYFGAGLKERDATRETIIAADRPGNHRKMFNVLCGDGHVETLTGGDSLEELARRRGLKLPASGQPHP